MTRVVEAQPGWRGRLHGFLGTCRWVADGPLPRVRVIPDSTWDGRSPDNAPFLLRPLPPRNGPACEVVVLPGEPTRIVVRNQHAQTDGQGTMLLARAFFATLRGDEPPRAVFGPLSDAGLARQLGVAPEKIPVNDAAPVAGPAAPATFGITWQRHRVEGQFSDLLPRLALLLARGIERRPDQTIRMVIPVDMRRHVPDLISTANLTGLIRLPVHELMEDSEPVAAIKNSLRRAMDNREEARVMPAVGFLRWLPTAFAAWIAKGGFRRSLRAGAHGSTAILSNLGRLDLAAFSGGGFQARRVFFIPPGNPGLPLFLGISGDDTGVELCGTMPLGLATDGRLGRLLESLGEGLRRGTR
ncbi:MAG: hypothetical protein JRJ84_21885 [Deltaproteobacteria bacterium]|nr:hypothetical protein [Deltaproteobacteria bacterium]